MRTGGTSRSACFLLVCTALASVACGLSERAVPGAAAQAGGSAGAQGEGSAAASGAGGGGANASGSPAAVSEPQPVSPSAARQAYLGTTAAPGCFTSAVATPDGFAVVGKYVQRSGMFEGHGDPTSSASWSSSQLTTVDGSALVFDTAGGHALVWSPGADGDPTGQRFDAGEVPGERLVPSALGYPVAGVELPDGLAVVFASQEGFVSLWRVQGGSADTVPLETGACTADGGFAAGVTADGVVVAYSCVPTAANGAPERRFVTNRVGADPTDVERTVTDLGLDGVPAAFFRGGEFLFAGAILSGGLVLAYVEPGNPTARVVPITGLSAATHRDDYEPMYSVVATDTDVLLTQATCDRHEDANATGSVALCRVTPDTGDAVCSKVDAPCAAATLVATSSGVVLLPCGFTAPSLVPLDPSAAPTPLDGLFPAGYAGLAPGALDCDGDACSALLRIDASEATTGYDERLALLELDLGPECEGALCTAGTPVPTELHSRGQFDVYPGGFTFENQPSGLPMAVVSATPSNGQNTQSLSLFGKDGVAWSQPLPWSPDAVFAGEDGFHAFSEGYLGMTGLSETFVTVDGVTDEPFLPMRLLDRAPSVARCGDRVFFHAVDDSQASATSPAHAAIFALDLVTSEFVDLFDPKVLPPDYAASAEPIGCAGGRLFILDGQNVHAYTLDGTRAPDIALRALATSRQSYDPLIAQMETRKDHVLVLRATSGADAIDALLLYEDGFTTSLTLPLWTGIVPLTSLRVAPDRGDGWLRAIYQGTGGAVYASAWNLVDAR